jgi:hypothetical protein
MFGINDEYGEQLRRFSTARVATDQMMCFRRFISALARETGGRLAPAQLQQACAQIALLKYIETIAEYGDAFARESLKRTPSKFITLINACFPCSRGPS